MQVDLPNVVGRKQATLSQEGGQCSQVLAVPLYGAHRKASLDLEMPRE